MAKTSKTSGKDSNSAKPDPGVVIAPGVSEPSSGQPAAMPEVPEDAKPAAVSAEAREQAPAQTEIPETKDSPVPLAEAAKPEQAQDPELPENGPSPDKSPAADAGSESVSWTASEFLAHHKSAGWYIALTIVTLLLAVLVFFLTKDMVSVGAVAVIGLMLGIYGSHKPKQLEYRIDKRGFSVGNKNHTYDEFKSFSIVPEGASSSIIFMPLKRFAPPSSLYYSPEDEKKIVAVLSGCLPLEEYKHDAIDNLLRFIRF